MITIFCNPRPFKGLFKITQVNSIKNWLKVIPNAQIILVEDEEGTTKNIAKKINVDYIPKVKTSKHGTPLLNDTFKKVNKKAVFETIAQIDIDVLVFTDFVKAIKKIKKTIPEFFMVGQRWNINIDNEINFDDSRWEKKLRKKLRKNGIFHPNTGSGYWVFSKGISINIPPFIVGRPKADNWLIYKHRINNVPTIDATQEVTVIHQNHPRLLHHDSYQEETNTNIKIYKDSVNSINAGMYYTTISDVTHVLAEAGLKQKKYGFIHNIFKKIIYARYYPKFLKSNKRFWRRLHTIVNPIITLYLKVKNLEI